MNSNVGYALSPDGLNWSPVVNLLSASGTVPPSFRYPTLLETEGNSQHLSNEFYLYYNVYPNDGTGWDAATLKRVTLKCDTHSGRE